MATATDNSGNIFSMENIRNGWLKLMEDLFRHVMQLTEGIESTTGYDFTPKTREFERFVFESGIVAPTEHEFERDLESASGSSLGATASGFDYASGFDPEFDIVSKPEIAEGIDFSDMFNLYDKNMGLAVQRVLSEVAGPDIDRFYQSIKDKVQKEEDLKIFLKRLIEKFLDSTDQKELYFLSIISRFFTMFYKSDGMDPKIFIEVVVDAIIEAGRDLQLVSVHPPEIFEDILNNSNNWTREFLDLCCGNESDYFPS